MNDRPRFTYLVMTQQIPTRTFQLVDASSIAEAAEHGIVMLLVRSEADESDRD